jgi:hypothetical protein
LAGEGRNRALYESDYGDNANTSVPWIARVGRRGHDRTKSETEAWAGRRGPEMVGRRGPKPRPV